MIRPPTGVADCVARSQRLTTPQRRVGLYSVGLLAWLAASMGLAARGGPGAQEALGGKPAWSEGVLDTMAGSAQKATRDWTPASAVMDTAVNCKGQLAARIYFGVTNYRNAQGLWKRCNTQIEAEPIGQWTHSVWETPYRLRLRTDRPRYKFDANGHYVIWELTNGGSLDSCTVEKDAAIWFLSSGVSLRLVCVPAGIKVTAALAGPQAPDELQFAYETSAERVAQRRADARLTFDFTAGAESVFSVSRPTVWDANGDEMDVILRLRAGMLTAQIDTAGAAYPIFLDPSTSIYGAGDEGDAYEDVAWRTAYGFFRIDERQAYDFEYWNTFPIAPMVYNGIIDTVEVRYYVYDGIFGGVVTPTSIHVVKQRSCPPVEPNTAHYDTTSGFCSGPASVNVDTDDSWYKADIKTAFNDWVASFWHVGTDTLAVRIKNSHATQDGMYDAYENSYSGTALDPYLYVVYTPISAPTDFVMTALSEDSIQCTWTDNASGEDGHYLAFASDSTVVDDSTAADVEADTVTGLGTNTEHVWVVVAYHSEGARAFSAADSEYTWSVAPGQMTVDTTDSPTQLRFVLSLGSNPEWTLVAIQDSVSGKFIDKAGDTLRVGALHADSTWMWKTYTDWGGALGDTLNGLSPATLYNLRAVTRSGE